MTKTESRNTNIELLRFISMLMIIAYHYSIYGFFSEDIIFSSNKIFVDIFGMFGKVGTDVFVLITGYYMVISRFTVKKLLGMMGQVWFYTLPALALYLLMGGELSLSLLKLSLMPLLFGQYWFVSYYLLLMLLSPFINTLIKAMDKCMHSLLCLFLFILCTALPEFLHLIYAGGSLPLFVALYICGAYCRLYIPQGKKAFRLAIFWAVLLTMFCMSRIILTDIYGQHMLDSARLESSCAFMNANSPFAFALALMLLIAFSCCKAGSKKLFSLLGGTSFGVYLLHENMFIRDLLWQPLLKTAEFAQSPWLFAHAIAALLLIYTAGCLVDIIRQKGFSPLWDRLCALLLNRAGRFIEPLSKKLRL